MAEKISAKLDDMRVSVAQSMFKPEQVVEEEVEIISEEEFQALSEEEQAEYELQEEQLDELSKSTLNNYKDMVMIDTISRIKKGEASIPKADQRIKGVKAANKRLGEEVESLDELSKGTLSSYVKKAANSLANKGAEIGKKTADADEVDRYTNRHMPNQSDERERMKKAVGADHESINKTRYGAIKRSKGIAKAADRLAK
jgi:hypothetical protein